jgi:hypothetical protein
MIRFLHDGFLFFTGAANIAAVLSSLKNMGKMFGIEGCPGKNQRHLFFSQEDSL